MKKRNLYFIISSILLIATYMYTMAIANEIIDNLMNNLGMMPEVILERMSALLRNSGRIYIIGSAAVGILINVYVIYIAYMDNILKKKGLVIGLLVISYFLAEIVLTQLIAIINIVVLACQKRVNPNDFPEKKEMPIIDKEKINKKKIIMAVFLLLVYFVCSIIIGYFFQGNRAQVVNIIFCFMFMIFAIYVFGGKFRSDLKLFRDNFSAYMNFILPKLGIYYIVFVFINLICMIIANNGTSANQNAVEAMPLYFSLPLAIIYAPIVEELLFRASVRRFIISDKVYIVLSGVMFGLLHTVFSETAILNIIINAIPYGLMGSFFAYLYVKTNNLCSSMFCHFVNNLFAMMMSILITAIIL